jgi:hypothetical protein
MQEANNTATPTGGAPAAAPAGAPAAAPISLTNTGGGAPAAAPTGAPAASTGGNNFTLPDNWRDQLPEDLKAEKSLEIYKDFPSIVKSLVHAQKQIGRDKIVIPDPKLATDEDYQNVFKKLGLPEDIKEYDVKAAPEAGLDAGFMDKFKENAHKLGILPRQAQKLIDWYAEESKAMISGIEGQVTAKKTEALEGLKKEWGNAFNQQLEAAQVAFHDFADEADVNYLNETGLNTDPTLLRIFAKIGMTLKEDEIKGKGGGSSTYTPADAQRRINEIMADRSHPHNDPKHVNHKQAVADMRALYQQAFPG